MKKESVKTNVILLLIVLFSFVAMIAKLSYVSLSKIIDGKDLMEFAKSRNTVNQVLRAERGKILDFRGEVLAESVKSYTVIAYLSERRTENPNKPRHIIDKEKTAIELSKILNMDKDVLLEKLNREKYQVEIKRNITEVTKIKIDELELPGIGYTESIKRYYKSGTFASYLVGYAKNTDDGEIIGELGIEGHFNKELKGIDGSNQYQKDGFGFKYPNAPEIRKDPIKGADIYLTLDSTIQLMLETAMNNINKLGTMEWGLISIIDGKTGAILGSATKPTFDPNDLNTLNSYLNPLVSFRYEPGSTIKTFSFGAAIDSGNFNGSETYRSGNIKVADTTIRDWNRHGWGNITYDRAFAVSSNVGATKLALKMGRNTLRSYYDKLGLGKKTGIELHGEVTGDSKFKYQTELATAAYGQGITITPIQMLQGYTTITNNGVMLKPYIVDKIVAADGDIIYEGKPENVEKVFEEETVKYLQKLMKSVVYENNDNRFWRPENMNIIGKTGTANIASKYGGYLKGPNDYIRSFVAIFPEEDPRYILYIATKKSTVGNSKTAPIIAKVLEEIANYSNLKKEEITNVLKDSYKVDNYISLKKEDILKNVNNFNTIILGDGIYIIDQYPSKGTKLFKGDKLILKTNSKEYIMPNIIGYSSNEVRTLTKLLNLKFESSGYGYVTSQSIEPGTVLTEKQVLSIVLN